jgi:hypothetical protein
MKPKLAMIKAPPPAAGKGGSKGLLAEVRELILEARQTVARGVNAALVLLYWNVGERIRKEILREKRAEYGQMIFSILSRQLGWSHFVELPPLKKHLQRDFYAEMCRIEGWSAYTAKENWRDALRADRPLQETSEGG